MLRELRVHDLALLEAQDAAFGPGLNALTGATGAGKSLVLTALTLLLGGRFAKDMLRTGARAARVEGVFEIEDPEVAAAVLELCGGEPEDATAPLELLVKRRVEAGGRNRCEVQGNLVTVATLRDVGTLLVEIHGQSEHQALLDPTHQVELLDRAAGLVDRRREFGAGLERWRALRDDLEQFVVGSEQVAARIEELEALAAEIGRVEPLAGESETLRRERRLLADAERFATSIGTALGLLDGDAGGADDGASDRLGRAARELDDCAELLPELASAVEALDGALAGVDDAIRALESASGLVRTDPERLEIVDDRLAVLGTLLRRHGPTEENALEAAAAALAEADRLRDGRRDHGALAAEVDALEAQLIQAGVGLNAARRDAAGAFCEAVAAALCELGMPQTRFLVDVDDGDPGDGLDARATRLGLGGLQFVASPNPGEEPRPLARIASGGELARVALAIKSELADADRVPLLVFDEVDADVGPRMGALIGRRLARSAVGRQVLVVTHLPQVAAHAARHLKVEKHVEDGRTTTSITAVTGADREHELAEMIRGAERADEALDQARAMLAEAAEAPCIAVGRP